MAQEVRLQGRTYSDVPSVRLPDSNGVFHPFTDVSDTTATASDVATGKYFYLADGTKTQGTSSGGGGRGSVTQDQDGYLVLDDDAPAPSITVEALSVTQNGTYTAPTGKAYSPVTVSVSGGGGGSWTRPADWPDLSQMDVSAGNILYMTSYADEVRGFCSFYCTCTGQYTVEVGTISGSTFTAESTQSFNSNVYCRLYYGSANGTFKVLKVTGTNITKLQFGYANAITIDTFYGYDSNQGIIDIVGRLPNCTSIKLRTLYNLVNVEISDVVLSGDISYMFYQDYALASIDVSSWDVSAVTNMSYLFHGCYSLISLDVSRWDTGSVENMSMMFQYCSSLTSLDVSGWDVSAVQSMGSMFAYCYTLTLLDVSKWETGLVSNTSSMFASCYSLVSLDVSGWDVSAVTNMYAMFAYCASLTSLDVSDWDTGSVVNMANVFNNCYSLTSLDVSGWDTGKATNMSYIFNYCYSLPSIDISSWDFSLVTATTSTGNMFNYCYGLHGSLTMPSTVTMIGSSCFNACRSLYEWHFKSTTPPTLNNTNAFSNMTDFGGKKIYVPLASLSAYQTARNWSTYASYMVGE